MGTILLVVGEKMNNIGDELEREIQEWFKAGAPDKKRTFTFTQGEVTFEFEFHPETDFDVLWRQLLDPEGGIET